MTYFPVMPSTPAVLFAAHAAHVAIEQRGAVFTEVELQPHGFRLAGKQAGKRLVIEVLFSGGPGAVTCMLSRQIGRTARSTSGTGDDHHEAVLAAISTI